MAEESADIPRQSSEMANAFQKVAATTKEAVVADRKVGKSKKKEKKGGLDHLKENAKTDAHIKPLGDLIKELQTDVNTGLSKEKVKQMQQMHGYNVLTPPAQKPEWLKLVETQTGFFSLLLWTGAILCFIGFALQGAMDNLYLGLVLAFVVLFTGIFEYFQERTSSNLMESFKNMMPQETMVIRTDAPDGVAIDAKDLVVGDIIKVKAGDKIPADIRIIECSEDMKVEQASLTGEPDHLERTPEKTDDNPLETKNLCFFGTQCPSGKAKCVVVAIGDNTVMGRISALATQTKAEQTPINKELERFVLLISAIAIFLGITFLIINFTNGTDPISNLVFMIGIIVANVPEGLLMTVTVCLTLTAKRMTTKMVLVKNLEAVETLGSTTCICSDKTGTLTINDMTVANVLYDCEIFETMDGLTKNRGLVDADGNSMVYPLVGKEDKEDLEPDWSPDSFRRLVRCATICNNATFEKKAKRGQFDKDGNPIYEVFREVVTLKDGSTIRQINWKTNGDASESAMIKFAQDKPAFDAAAAAKQEANADARDEQVAEWAAWYQGQTKGMSPEQLSAFKLGDAYKQNPRPQELAPDGIMAARAAYPLRTRKVGNNEQAWEVPFNSGNKYQISVHVNQDGSNLLQMKGASERIMGRCGWVRLHGKNVPMTPELRSTLNRKMEELAAKGRRVLAFAEKELDPAKYPADFAFDTNNYNFPVGEPADQDEAVNMCGMPKDALGVKDHNADQEAKFAANPSFEMTLKHEESMEKLVFLGFFALIDPPRAAVPGAVAKCKTAGIRVVMVTGDHPATAEAISKEVGIIWGETAADRNRFNEKNGFQPGDPGYRDPDTAPAVVVPGWTFDNDTPQEKWDDIMQRHQIVFARTSPQQKLVIVENFKNWDKTEGGRSKRRSKNRGREIVAVTGDGVNDAPALKAANIGVAMGIMGSQVSKDAADMILLDDNFASIVAGVEEGRLIFDNLKKSIAYTLSSNIPEISPFLIYTIIGLPLPLSTVLILCIDLGTDLVPAVSMAWENAEADIMRRMPRNSETDHLVTFKLINFAYLQVGVIQAVAGFFTYLTVLNDYGYPPHVLPTLGQPQHDSWGKQTLYCQVRNGVFRNVNGKICGGSAADPTVPGWTQFNAALNANEPAPDGFDSTRSDHFALAQRCFNQGYFFYDPYGAREELPEGDLFQATLPTPLNSNTANRGDVLNCDFPLKNYGGLYAQNPQNANDWQGKMGKRPQDEGAEGDYNDAIDTFQADQYVSATDWSDKATWEKENHWRDYWFSYEGYEYNDNVATVQTIRNMHLNGYLEYLPYKARLSNFFDARWLAWPRRFPGPGVGVLGMGRTTHDLQYFNAQPQGLWFNDLTDGGLKTTGTAAPGKMPAAVRAESDAFNYPSKVNIDTIWYAKGSYRAFELEKQWKHKKEACDELPATARIPGPDGTCPNAMVGNYRCPCQLNNEYQFLAVNRAQLGVFRGRWSYPGDNSVGTKSPAGTWPHTAAKDDSQMSSFVPSLYTWADTSMNWNKVTDNMWYDYAYGKVLPVCGSGETAVGTSNATTGTTFQFCRPTDGSLRRSFTGNDINTIAANDMYEGSDLAAQKGMFHTMGGSNANPNFLVASGADPATDPNVKWEAKNACDPSSYNSKADADADDCTVYTNVASRQLAKEAWHYAQTAGLICIIIVQWADLMICKTRWLSIRQQGMSNRAMNFGLVFETILGAALCYITPLGVALGTRPLRFTHWLPGIPFSVFIFLYDETRKYLMRDGPCGLGSAESVDENTKRITRLPGWLEKWTYY